MREETNLAQKGLLVELSELLHYGTIALIVALNAIGVGIGQGITSKVAISAMDAQPSAHDDIRRVTFLGMALIETAAVMGSVVALMLLFGQEVSHSLPVSIAQAGIACAMCFAGISTGILSALPAAAACRAIARQPFFEQKISRLMLLTLSLIQTPVIFGFIIGLIIQAKLGSVYTFSDGIRLLSSGLCVGIASIGTAVGLSLFAKAACEGTGINKNAYNKLLSFTFVSQAIIETPMIFALIIALTLLFTSAPPAEPSELSMVRFLGAALCAGLGALGASIGSGRTAAAACSQIAVRPDLYSPLSRTCLFAQGLIETCAIYPLIIALGLLFFAR